MKIPNKYNMDFCEKVNLKFHNEKQIFIFLVNKNYSPAPNLSS